MEIIIIIITIITSKQKFRVDGGKGKVILEVLFWQPGHFSF